MTAQFCDKHWQPYAAREANGIAAQAFLMFFVTRDDRWLSLIDRGDGVSDTSPEGLNRAMEKIAPACCWIPEARIAAVLEAARECNPPDSEHLSGAALAAVQVEAFNAWQANHREDAS